MMDAINSFLTGLSVAERNALWRGFIAVFALLFAAATVLYIRKTGEKIKKSLTGAGLVVATYVVVLLLAFAVNALTHSLIPVSGNVYYLPGAAICAVVLGRYLHCSFMDALDIVTISFLFPRSIHLFGCAFSGCCQGCPAAWGIYSAISKAIVVPVNELEAIGIFIAWYILNRYYRKNQYMTHGKVAAFGYAAYGAINYISDIFTVGVRKLIFMTSIDGIVPFITMCVGLVMLYLLDKKKVAIAAEPSEN